MFSAYPWSNFNKNALEWMYLPDFIVAPNPVKLLGCTIFLALHVIYYWYHSCCRRFLSIFIRLLSIARVPNRN